MQDIGAGHLTWQIYGGNAYDVDPPSDSRDRRIIGSRLIYNPPIDGLRFMVSGYQTQVEILADNSLVKENRGILSADYVNDNLDLKAEYANHTFMGVASHAYYVQGGYKVTEKWTPFIRYDYVTTDVDQSDDPSYYQKTFAIGLDYKLDQNISLRLEDHINRGYALPVASEEVTAGAGQTNWNLFAASINFAF
jgi:predicted porin